MKIKRGGTNIVSASVGLIVNFVGLIGSVGKATVGIMNMPADISRASPAPPLT